MKDSVSVLKRFSYIWFGSATVLVLAGIFGVWMTEGSTGVKDTFKPCLVGLIIAGPVLVALLIAERLEKKNCHKTREQHHPTTHVSN